MNSKVTPTPRLLIGAALLFWGAMTDHALVGLLACLLVEGANWIRLRWDFQTAAYSLAWRICILLIFVSGALIWLDGERHTALSRVLLWMPILLLPLQFTQSYGLSDSMPLSVFALFQKQRQARYLRYGLGASTRPFHFGNAYFVAIIFTAGLGVNAQQMSFVLGFIILAGCFIFFRVKERTYLVISLLLAAAGLGFAGQQGMRKLYQWATGYGSESRFSTDSNMKRTSIGSLGKIKQSPEMLWRLRVTEGFRAPRLLQLASYNRYLGPIWKNQIPAELLANYAQSDVPFLSLSTRDSSTGEPLFFLRAEMTAEDLAARLPSFQLRGAIRAEDPLPLPGDAASLSGFDLDDIEANPLGSVRVFPKRAIIDGTVRWGDSMPSEGPPWLPQDSEIPSIEAETIASISAELGLAQLPSANAKAARIAAWFASDFTYTRHLSIFQSYQTKPSALSLFLTTQRRGHCEYFATAATLLLRSVGVPARYSVGYAVMELDPKLKQYIIRGSHAHAWCRYWDEGKKNWIDFDPTPPDWFAKETTNKQSRWLSDTYQRLKEDFFIWRNRPSNRLAVSFVIWGIGILLLFFIISRLWKSRLRSPTQASPRRVTNTSDSALYDLEKQATRILGPRPLGQTYASWLRGLTKHQISNEQLEAALSLHQSIRFDPSVRKIENQQNLAKLVAAIRSSLPHS